MTQITWRRYRIRIIALSLYVVALIVFMILTHHAFQDAATVCGRLHIDVNLGRHCNAAASAESHGSLVETAIALLPLFIGFFLGTPMVASELERKTNRLAWSQGITRTKWLVRTWLTLAIPTVVVMSLFALIVQWWATHIVTSISSGGGLIQPAQMLISGVAPIAFALLLLTLGMFIGTTVRRFFSPYATSVVAFVAVLAVMQFVLPSLAAKVVVPTHPFGVTHLPNGLRSRPWFIKSVYRFVPGIHVGNHLRTVGAVLQFCKGNPMCYQAHGLQIVSLYQPASHYWVLQWREAGIYIAATGVLLSLSIWSIRRWSA
jgi:ABC-type transport system involved in multi-copper enzyme maturation permease subunit